MEGTLCGRLSTRKVECVAPLGALRSGDALRLLKLLR
jgi:hypothetical protein